MTAFEDDWRLVEAFDSWLAGRGYRLVGSQGPEGMASALRLYRGGGVVLRVTSDRGQWFLAVGPDQAGDLESAEFTLEAWGRVLGWPAWFHSASIDTSWNLVPQLDWLRAHLEQIEAASSPERVAGTYAALVAARRALAAFPPRSG